MKRNALLSLMLAVALVSCGDNESEKEATPEAKAAQAAEQVAEAKAEAAKAAAEAKEEGMKQLQEAQEAYNDGDFEEAFELAMQAADEGNIPEAQFFVAKMYFEGKGTESDLVKSYTWGTLSNIYKVEGSRRLINGIYRKLSPAQLAESKAAVKAYLAEHK